MNPNELTRALRALAESKKNEQKELDAKYRRLEAEVYDRFAKNYARFSVGQVIIKTIENCLPTILKIESVSASMDSGLQPHIIYRGTALLPDLDVSRSVSTGEPRKESIYDYDDGKVSLLDKPLYDHYVVEHQAEQDTKAKKNHRYMRYMNALENFKSYCLQHLDAVMYGIGYDGTKEELHRNHHLERYFKR